MPIRAPAACTRLLPLLVAGVVLLAGCGTPLGRALGMRQTVDDTLARDVLATAVGLAGSGQADRLCELSPAEASTCEGSLAEVGSLVPESGPEIVCSVAAPDFGPLRGGRVLVVTGRDINDDPYTSEFIVYDTGERIGVLDAVWWNGLTVRAYDDTTVTWGFDSASATCQRGGLPVEG